MTHSYPLISALLAAAFVAAPAVASAQGIYVNPDGSQAEPAAPVTQPPPATGTAPAAPVQGGAAPAGGYYHTDELVGDGDGDGGDDPTVIMHGGTTPSVHVVRSGDTLWDISSLYFSNPWEWPRVWSYNPEITNPHWIYPDDKVRLDTRRNAPAVTAGTGNGTAPIRTEPRADGDFELRQLAFVSAEERRVALTVDGSPEEKVLLAAGDEVYLSYPAASPPTVGKRYSIYLERKRVFHPKDREQEVGAYVRIVGEVDVISVMKGKRARGVIADGVDVIERGMKVGPLQRQFRNVEPTPARVDLEGTIVAELGTEKLIGARQVVFIDRGSEQGIVAGNQMEVIRRGDAYEDLGARTSEGKNDRRYPASSLGRVMVVQTGKRASIAVVTHSRKEIGVGDRVLLIKKGR